MIVTETTSVTKYTSPRSIVCTWPPGTPASSRCEHDGEVVVGEKGQAFLHHSLHALV